MDDVRVVVHDVQGFERPLAVDMPFKPVTENEEEIHLHLCTKEKEDAGESGEEEEEEEVFVVGRLEPQDKVVEGGNKRGINYIGKGAMAEPRKRSRKTDATTENARGDSEPRQALVAFTQDKDGKQTMHIIPMMTKKPIYMKARVDGVAYFPDRTAKLNDADDIVGGIAPVEDDAARNAEEVLAERERKKLERAKLTNAFGSKSANTAMARQARQKVDDSALDARVGTLLMEAAGNARTEQDVQREAKLSMLEGLPPHNLAATRAEDAYPLDGLVPMALHVALEQDLRELYDYCTGTGTLHAPPGNRPFSGLVERIGKLILGIPDTAAGDDDAADPPPPPPPPPLFGADESEETKHKTQKLRALVLLSSMIRFSSAPPRSFRVQDTDEPVSRISSKLRISNSLVTNFLLDRFSEQQWDTEGIKIRDSGAQSTKVFAWARPQALKDQLMMHALALFIACHDYTNCDIFDLARDMHINPTAMMKVAYEIGAERVKKPGTALSTSTVISLLPPREGDTDAATTSSASPPTLEDKLPRMRPTRLTKRR